MTTETTTTTTCTDCQRIEAEEKAHEAHWAECAEYRREWAREMAGYIQRQPGCHPGKDHTGADDAILGDDWKPTGYRMTDFYPESELEALRTYQYGWDESENRPNTLGEWLAIDTTTATPEGDTVAYEWHRPPRPDEHGPCPHCGVTLGRLIADDPPGDEEARSHTVNTNNPRLQSNNAITNDPCAYCGATTDPCGFDVMAPIPVSWSTEPSYTALVCHDCAETRAPGQEAFGQALAHMNGALHDVPVEAWPSVLAVVEEWARAYMHYVNVGPVAFWSETPAEATP